MAITSLETIHAQNVLKWLNRSLIIEPHATFMGHFNKVLVDAKDSVGLLSWDLNLLW